MNPFPIFFFPISSCLKIRHRKGTGKYFIGIYRNLKIVVFEGPATPKHRKNIGKNEYTTNKNYRYTRKNGWNLQNTYYPITSSTRTSRGGSYLKDIYKRPFSSIELACAVRQPSPCVRTLCESGVLFHMSHLKLHFALHTSHCFLHTPHCTLHTSHSTLLTSHCTLPNPHFTLHTARFPLHSPHFTLLTAHCFLNTPHFTLQSSRPHFTLHSSHSILHLIWALPPYPSSSLLFSYVTTMRSAETELQSTIELCAMASEIAAPKPDLDAKATKRRF